MLKVRSVQSEVGWGLCRGTYVSHMSKLGREQWWQLAPEAEAALLGPPVQSGDTMASAIGTNHDAFLRRSRRFFLDVLPHTSP